MPRSVNAFKGRCLLVAGGWHSSHRNSRNKKNYNVTPEEFYLVDLKNCNEPDMAIDFTAPYVVEQFEGRKFDFIFIEGINEMVDERSFIQLFKNAAALLTENGVMFYKGAGGPGLTTDAIVKSGFEAIKTGIETNILISILSSEEPKPHRQHEWYTGSSILASKQNHVIDEQTINALPEEAQKIILSQVDTDKLLRKEISTENLNKTIKNFVNYKNNMFFGLSWLKSSDESLKAKNDMVSAANNHARFDIAKKYIEQHPDKAFAKELMKVCPALKRSMMS